MTDPAEAHDLEPELVAREQAARLEKRPSIPSASGEFESRTAANDGLRLAELFEGHPNGLVVFVDRRVAFANAALAQLLGHTTAELLIGLRQDEFFELHVPADRRAELFSQLSNSATAPRVIDRHTRWRRRDGSFLAASYSLWPFTLNSRPAVSVIVHSHPAENDTWRTARSERLTALGKLAAGVAHEVNNPLTYMAVNLDLALEELRQMQTSDASTQAPRVDSMLQALDDVRDGIHRVSQIVDDLKTLAVSEQCTSGTVDLRSILDSAISDARSRLSSDTRVIREYQDVPAVRAAEPWLRKVFGHLLLNAAQALAGSSNPPEIRVRLHLESGQSVRITVADTGHGIPADIQPRVFDPFFSTRPVGTGRGLGLAVCHTVVTALGGEISLQSQVGRGTTVAVLLPINAVRAPR